MGMFGPREGSWWLNCPSDPRWNCGGRSLNVGGFAVPAETTAKIEELKKTLGEPPEDLEFGYMKD